MFRGGTWTRQRSGHGVPRVPVLRDREADKTDLIREKQEGGRETQSTEERVLCGSF